MPRRSRGIKRAMRYQVKILNRNRVWAVFVAFGLTVASCAPTFNTHGYLPPQEDVDTLIIGVDDKASVEELIGQPLSTGLVEDSGWYYISTRVRNFTYNEPEITERNVLAISFNPDDTISNIERLTLANGEVIALNRRVTKIPVKGVSFWRQIVSSLGNIRAEDFTE